MSQRGSETASVSTDGPVPSCVATASGTSAVEQPSQGMFYAEFHTTKKFSFRPCRTVCQENTSFMCIYHVF